MAKYQLLLPKMGESVAEATVIKWVKKPGDYIETDEAVMEIATDKVDSEVPSPVSGKLVEQLCKEDDVVQVGAVIAVIETEEPAAEPPVAEEKPAPEPEPVKEPEPVAAEPQEQAPETPAAHEPKTEPEAQQEEPSIPAAEPVIQHFDAIPGIDLLPSSGLASGFKSNVSSGRFYSPLVKSIAMQENVSVEELDSIPGTGLEGRLTKDDLIQFIQQRHMRPPVAKTAEPAPVAAPQTAQTEPTQHQPAPVVEAPAAEQPEHAQTAPHAHAPETVIPELEIPVMAAAEAAQPAPAAEPAETEPAASEPEKAEEPVQEEVPTEIPVEETPAVETPEVEAPTAEETQQQEPADEPVAAETTPEAEPVTEETAEQPVAETTAPAEEPAKPEPAYAETRTYPGASLSGGDEIIEMDRMRRMIAEHMVYSKHTSPHVTSFVEADVTHIVTWREKNKVAFEKQTGEKVTYTPIFIEAVVKAITDFPLVNVTVNGTKITRKKDINIGMATALPSGNLIVPVIKKASELNLLGLTKSVNDLANRARNSKLLPDDVKDGTFTITNVGSFGNLMGTPIINQPQVAILAVGAIKKKPAVIETPDGDFIGIRHMMFLSLSYDHRIVDGALGGSFLRKIADYLESWDVNRKI